ncbi:TPA: hypothetical protein R1887_005314 [Klebsiella oxytoca]|nr:hypothetical protein [Klebsiella oxytoca]
MNIKRVFFKKLSPLRYLKWLTTLMAGGIAFMMGVLTSPQAHAGQHNINSVTGPTFSEKTGSLALTIHCQMAGGTNVQFCDRMVSIGRFARTKINCNLTSAGESKLVSFTSDTTLKGWTVKTWSGYTTGIRTTGNSIKTIYDNNLGANANYIGIVFTAAYSTGTIVKPLDIYCILDNGEQSVGRDKDVSKTFTPPVNATFSVNGSPLSASSNAGTHRVKDYGEHTFNLSFGDTIWNSERQLKISMDKNANGCKLAAAKGTLEFNSKSVVFDPGTTLAPKIINIKTDNPSSAVLKLKTKASAAGAYECNITLTQNVS